MACPACGCKTTYSYEDWDAAGPLNENMQRCVACGAIFDVEDELPEDEDEA